MANFSFSQSGATPHMPFHNNRASSPGNTPAEKALAGAQMGVQQAPPPMPLMPPTSGNVKSHKIIHPDGTTIEQTFHPPVQEGLLNKSKPKPQAAPALQSTMPEMKVINGKHHVPFKGADGKVRFINADGQITE